MKIRGKRIIKLNFQSVVPFVAFFVIFLFFTIASYNARTGTFRMLSLYNLTIVLEQTMQTIIVACGALFVVSQGSSDLSVGVNLGLSAVISVWAAHATGLPYIMIPLALIVGLVMGILNGVIVSKFKVPSFMVTLAMLIGVRGLVNYIQVSLHTQRLPSELAFLNTPWIKATIFFVIIIIMAYVFEFTNVGRYSRAIGDNETAAKFVGVPVDRMKIIAFALSGLMAGVGAIFNVVSIDATTATMGIFLEIRVIMAVFLGGVLVTGGSTAKFYKILLGSLSIQIIINGLVLIGRGNSHITQSVQGVLLLLILLASAIAGTRENRVKEPPEETVSGAIAEDSTQDEEPAEEADANP